MQYIRKTCPCNIYLLEPHFYIVKLGFTGVYLFFLFLLQNIDCGYSLEPPQRGGSNVYPHSMFRPKIRKISKFFLWNFQFLQVKKNLCILHGHVFVMRYRSRHKQQASHTFSIELQSLFYAVCNRVRPRVPWKYFINGFSPLLSVY